MKKTDIDERYADVLTTQEYGASIPIDGVEFYPLKHHRDETGDFVELGRLTDGKLEVFHHFTVAQVSTSRLLPGAVKAFHLHFNQTDLWYVSPEERVLVGLLDTRRGSKTLDKTMRFIMGGGDASLLYIPPGVAHGVANLWDKPATVTYFTDHQFDPADEHRLPCDLFGEEFWQIKKG